MQNMISYPIPTAPAGSRTISTLVKRPHYPGILTDFSFPRHPETIDFTRSSKTLPHWANRLMEISKFMHAGPRRCHLNYNVVASPSCHLTGETTKAPTIMNQNSRFELHKSWLHKHFPDGDLGRAFRSTFI
jgi:hypothetical protein